LGARGDSQFHVYVIGRKEASKKRKKEDAVSSRRLKAEGGKSERRAGQSRQGARAIPRKVLRRRAGRKGNKKKGVKDLDYQSLH